MKIFHKLYFICVTNIIRLLSHFLLTIDRLECLELRDYLRRRQHPQ